MRVVAQRLSLPMVNRWATSRGGVRDARVVVVALEHEGVRALGEASPIARYDESVDTVSAFIASVDPQRLRFDDIAHSMAYVAALAPGQHAAKSAISIALHDGAARRAQQSVAQQLGLSFVEGRHRTSFSLGIASPEEMRLKALQAAEYPVLKLKLGGPDDAASFEAVRDAAPDKPIRVDANEAWLNKEQALSMIEWLARDGNVEFVEQPMPASTAHAELSWLRARSPLPLIADESFHDKDDVSLCVDCFHGVNAKLCKTSGIAGAVDALTEARRQGLRTMLGCMVETSVAISAAAQLAELCDYLDLDGNLLLAADPYEGVTCERGVLSFAHTVERHGIRARARLAP